MARGALFEGARKWPCLDISKFFGYIPLILRAFKKGPKAQQKFGFCDLWVFVRFVSFYEYMWLDYI